MKSKLFYLQELHQNLQLQIFIQANITVGKKPKNLPSMTIFIQWSFYKGVL